ncbi:unnamed protein product, partial [Dibothriocephalus latus]
FWRNIFGPEGPPGPIGEVKTNFTVHAVPLRHTVPSIGYLMVESPSPPRMMMEKVHELGVPPGPLLGKLKKVLSVASVYVQLYHPLLLEFAFYD